MPIQAVIFDWAGTMVDFGSRAPVTALRQLFEEVGVPVSEDVVRRYMGTAKRDHVIAILTETASQWRSVRGTDWTDAVVDDLMDRLDTLLSDAATLYTELIPGAHDALDYLSSKDIRVGSTTGYTRAMMKGVEAQAAAQGYTPETIICAGETPEGRPAPLMVWKCCIDMGVWPAKECVVVDDTPVGVEAGKNAGTWTVGLAGSGNELGLSANEYKLLTREERARRLAAAAVPLREAGADFVIETVADLPKVCKIIETRLTSGSGPGEDRTEICFTLE